MKDEKNKNSLRYQLKTFVFAFRGIAMFFRKEQKAVIHLVAAILAIAMSWYLKISAIEWILIITAIVLVFIAELFNTITESLSDLVQPEYDQRVGAVKDMAAGAVLLAALLALCTGIIIFVPKLYHLLECL